MNSEGPVETADDSLLNDPGFSRLLARRSRLRWSFSSVLIAVYLAWALAGIYAPDAMGASFRGSLLTWGMFAGYVIIAASIACAIVYIQIINRLHLSFTPTKPG